MSNCCTCTYQISGCYNVCADILLELEGIENGTYTVNAGYYSFSAIASDGVLTIPAGTLNENDCQELQIEGYSLTVDGKTYDCFKLKTKYELVAADFNGGGGGSDVVDSSFCQRVQLCMAGFTPEVPAIQAPATVLIQNTTYSLEGYSLDFLGNEIDGNQLIRDFDPDGNDLGGFNNSVGADCLFNSIRGYDNSLSDNCEFNTIVGVNNNLGTGNLVNNIFGNDNTLGNDNSGSFLGATNVTIGDNNAFSFAIGLGHVFSNNLNYSAAWGVGHNVTNEQSYYFGRFSVPLDTAADGGIVLGNGTSDIARSNAFEALLDGRLVHSGAYANKPTRYTGGGNHTIPDNVSVYIYDPGVIQAGATITLPANPLDGHKLYILGGGTITSGDVITGFTLDGNGRTVIGDSAANLKVGKAYELHYCGDNNIWYAIAF